jgi:hypothetical protein
MAMRDCAGKAGGNAADPVAKPIRRLASGEKHAEAITTRPLFLQLIARHAKHAQQNHLSLSSLHAKSRIHALLHGAEGLKPEGVADAREELGRAVVEEDALDDGRAEFGHAVVEPERDAGAVQGKTGVSGALHGFPPL